MGDLTGACETGMRIGLIAPYRDLADLACEVSRELNEDIEVRVGDLSEGVRIAREMQREKFDVIISRGGTALAIRQGVDLPVVEIQVTGFDLLRAISEARKFGSRVGVIGFRNVVYNSHSIQEILGIRIEEIILENEESAPSKVSEAVQLGVDVVVGDAVSVALAGSYGIPGVLVRSGREAIAQAISEAKYVAEVRIAEQHRARQLHAIIDFSRDGIIATDSSGRITVFNPIAEKILGRAAKDVIGSFLNTEFPDLILRGAGKKDKEGSEIGKVKRVGETFILYNQVPIVVGEHTTGSVITFQDVSRIQQEEERVRKELYLKGHVARYTFSDIVGQSEKLRGVIARAKEFARVDSTVLIIGESGTGKELFAQSIHNESGRSSGPFVAVNCAALPENLP